MPTLSLYKRLKVGDSWKYHRIREGRGHRTSDLSGPFYARPFHNGRQYWKTLLAETFEEARDHGSLCSRFPLGSNTSMKATPLSLSGKTPRQTPLGGFLLEKKRIASNRPLSWQTRPKS